MSAGDTIEVGDRVRKIGVIGEVWTVTRLGWGDLGRRVAYLETTYDGLYYTDRIATDHLEKEPAS